MTLTRVLISILLCLFIGLATFNNLQAYRISKPDKITEINDESLVRLNTILEDLWDITNSRYQMGYVTTNPDGSRNGDIGDFVLFNNNGTYYLAINVDGLTTWRSVQLTDTP